MPHENRRSRNSHREAARLLKGAAVEPSVRLRENIAFSKLCNDLHDGNCTIFGHEPVDELHSIENKGDKIA
jgi:hypothetical protein